MPACGMSLRCSLATVLLGGLGVFPMTAISSEVALTSSDGVIDFTGDLVAFEDGGYVVGTALGDLHVNADRVRCEGESCPASRADVRFAGSNTFGLGMMPLLLEGYASHRDAEVSFIQTGFDEHLAEFVALSGFGDHIGSYLVRSDVSGDAFEALLDGSADLGMTTRRITPDEARNFRDAGAGNMVSPDQEHVIAIDSLVVITNMSNPVQTITMDQLGGIFAGRITNWNELGGEDRPIAVINRQIESGTRSVFYGTIFGNGDPESALENEVIADDNNTAARLVNEDPGAIGFVGHAFQRGAKALTLVNECGMPTQPDAFSARVEEYALQRRLYIYNRGGPMPKAAQDFLEYAMSEEADSVISKSGFIDLGIRRKSQDLNGPRARMLLDPNVDAYEGSVMREMLSQMVNFDRLSTTFRFPTGSSRLDERGALDMKRLANYLEGMPNGTKVLFVGFTDSVGAFERNRTLSQLRAGRVAAELQSYAGDRLSGLEFGVSGFGEIAPSACNVSEKGRAINRRVEVWIETGRNS